MGLVVVHEVRLSEAWVEPQVSGLVINKDTEVASFPQRKHLHWATDVRMELPEVFMGNSMPLLE